MIAMREGIYGIKKIEKDDSVWDFPETFNSNIEIMVGMIEKIQMDLAVMKRKVTQLERNNWD